MQTFLAPRQTFVICAVFPIFNTTAALETQTRIFMIFVLLLYSNMLQYHFDADDKKIYVNANAVFSN